MKQRKLIQLPDGNIVDEQYYKDFVLIAWEDRK